MSIEEAKFRLGQRYRCGKRRGGGMWECFEPAILIDGRWSCPDHGRLQVTDLIEYPNPGSDA